MSYHGTKSQFYPGNPSRTVANSADAQVPTVKGQIGVNPVESDLGDPDTYLGEIYGTDTLYITPVETGTAVRLTLVINSFSLTL